MSFFNGRSYGISSSTQENSDQKTEIDATKMNSNAVNTAMFSLIQSLFEENQQQKKQIQEMKSHIFKISSQLKSEEQICSNMDKRNLTAQSYESSASPNYLQHGKRYSHPNQNFQRNNVRNSKPHKRKPITQSYADVCRVGTPPMLNSNERKLKNCKFCGELHIWGPANCKQYGKTCSNCFMKNHSAAVCQKKIKKIKVSRSLRARHVLHHYPRVETAASNALKPEEIAETFKESNMRSKSSRRRLKKRKAEKTDNIAVDINTDEVFSKEESDTDREMETNNTGAVAGECGFCGENATLKCSKCRLVFYCSKEHEAEDSKTHDPVCRKFAPYGIRIMTENGTQRAANTHHRESAEIVKAAGGSEATSNTKTPTKMESDDGNLTDWLEDSPELRRKLKERAKLKLSKSRTSTHVEEIVRSPDWNHFDRLYPGITEKLEDILDYRNHLIDEIGDKESNFLEEVIKINMLMENAIEEATKNIHPQDMHYVEKIREHDGTWGNSKDIYKP